MLIVKYFIIYKFLGGNDAEVFRNRKSYFSINTQLVASPNLKIMDITARWPGSAHDSTVLNNSSIRARFEQGEFQNTTLLGNLYLKTTI